jgi:hypothetical protein
MSWVVGHLAGNMSSATVGDVPQKDAPKHAQSGMMKVVAPAAPGQGPFLHCVSKIRFTNADDLIQNFALHCPRQLFPNPQKPK